MPEKKRRQNLDDLRAMNERELDDALANERRKLYEARTKDVTKQLENTSAIGNIRKQIARILTLQNERQSVANEARDQLTGGSRGRRIHARTPPSLTRGSSAVYSRSTIRLMKMKTKTMISK